MNLIQATVAGSIAKSAMRRRTLALLVLVPMMDLLPVMMMMTTTTTLAIDFTSKTNNARIHLHHLRPRGSLLTTRSAGGCIRGGGAAAAITVAQGGESPTTNVGQWISPYWISFSRFLEQNVEPAFKDPKTKLLAPIQEFCKERKKAAKERHYIIETKPTEAAVALLHPSRVLKLGLCAWIVAELLHQFGCFDNSRGVSQKIQQAWKQHAEDRVSTVCERIRDWWEDERKYSGLFHIQTYRDFSLLMSKLSSFPARYQFALGGAMGMIASPLLWSLSLKFFKGAIGIYIFSELNEYWRATSSIGESAVELLGFRGSGGETVNEFLESVRDTVRSLVRNPKLLWEEAQEYVQDTTGVPVIAKQGFLVGTLVGVIVV